MKITSVSRLPYEIRERAERTAKEDLSNVEVAWCVFPSYVSAYGYTRGNCIYLSQEVLRLPHNERVEIFGHEIAHTLQCGQKVAADSTCRNSVVSSAVNLGLEVEAVNAGRLFANGGSQPFSSVSRRVCGQGEVQCYLVLNGVALSSVEELSDQARIVAGMIKKGVEWFDWAVTQQRHGFSYSNEPELLEGIQLGLHGSCLMRVADPGLLISPAKLMELTVDDLTLLVNTGTTKKKNKVANLQMSKMLGENQIRISSDLAIGTDFLEQMGVADNELFQVMSLNDLIELFDLVNSASSSGSLDSAIQKEATRFAVAGAQNPGEFADLYRFYLALEEKLPKKTTKAAKRVVLAEQLYEEISESLYSACLSPRVTTDLSGVELRSIIQNWIDGGKHVGFANLPRGAAQVMKGSAIGEPAKTVNISDATDQYMEEVQEFIKTNEADSLSLSQDGAFCRYYLESGNSTAALEVDKQGYLTLLDFQKVTKSRG